MKSSEIDEIMENFKRACKEAAISFNKLADTLNAQHKRKRKTTKVDTSDKSKVLNMPVVTNRAWLFQYRSMGQELMVQLEASSLNDVLILFATRYHMVDEIYEITEVS